jgi:hypothetical protein
MTTHRLLASLPFAAMALGSTAISVVRWIDFTIAMELQN